MSRIRRRRATPVGETLRLRLDYSVAAVVTWFNAGVLMLKAKPGRPARVRCRGMDLEVDLTKSGLDRFGLGYDDAEIDVEDPGVWSRASPGSLLGVVGGAGGAPRSAAWAAGQAPC